MTFSNSSSEYDDAPAVGVGLGESVYLGQPQRREVFERMEEIREQLETLHFITLH